MWYILKVQGLYNPDGTNLEQRCDKNLCGESAVTRHSMWRKVSSELHLSYEMRLPVVIVVDLLMSLIKCPS